MDKRTYYQNEKVVADYEDWRFGSAGGRYVDDLEKTTIVELLGSPPLGRVLDMPCGTGRLLSALHQAGFPSVEGADSSPAMLKLAADRVGGFKLQQEDAFNTSYSDASFDAICSLRFLFHVEDPAVLFREVSRILRPGGLFVFDSLRWTPRNKMPFVNQKLGGRLYTYTETHLSALLRIHGFELVAARRVLLLPSQAYRPLPQWAVTVVRAIEGWLPGALCTKVIVLAKRNL